MLWQTKCSSWAIVCPPLIYTIYSAVQINSDSDEMRQIFVKIRFNLKSYRNYLTNDIFNMNYDPLCLYKHFHPFWHRINLCGTHLDNFIIMVPGPNNSINQLLYS